MNETQGGVRRDTILDRYSIEPLDSLFRTPAEETALLIKLRRKVISQFMCRSRPSLPRAALFSLPHRRRITLHALLFSPFAERLVLFPLRPPSSPPSSVLSSVVPSHRGAPQGPPGQTEHTNVSGGIHCVGGDRSKENDGSSKRHHVTFTSPTRVACSPLLTAPNPCTPLERAQKRLAQPTVIHKVCQCLVRHVSRLQVDGRAARRSRQASEKKRRGQQSTLSSSPQGAN